MIYIFVNKVIAIMSTKGEENDCQTFKYSQIHLYLNDNLEIFNVLKCLISLVWRNKNNYDS